MSEDKDPVEDREEDLESTGVSRREFLGITALALGGLAVSGSILAACADDDEGQEPTTTTAAGTTTTSVGGEQWDETTDIVVAGSGCAAYSAACAALNAGSQVMMFEKSSARGGTTAKSGGTYWICNNHLMQEAGLQDPKEGALRYMARLAYPMIYNPEDQMLGLPEDKFALIETFYDRGAEAVKAFADMGALQSQIQPSLDGAEEVGEVDYHADLPEDEAPRGRALQPAGEQGFGAGLVNQLAAFAEQRGVTPALESPVTSVVVDENGEVAGVTVESAGQTRRIRARKAVVFGSGGFTHNVGMRLNFLRGPVFGGCAVPACQGDIVRLAAPLGAQLGNMQHAWWSEIVFETAAENPSVPNNVWLPFGDSMIIVNKYGRRVANEKMVYNERTQVHFQWDPTTREYPNLLLFQIYDDAVAQNELPWPFRYPIPLPNEQSDLVITGQSWQELAQALGERLAQYQSITGGLALAEDFAQNLEQTVQEFNQFAESGTDEMFRRGETPIQLAWNGPAPTNALREPAPPNPTMALFSENGPYHAIILAGGTLDTKGGPAIDTGSHILAAEGQPIPRLYGAGNCIASPAGQAYWSAGGTLGPALTFGYIAGLNAAAEAARE